MNPLLEVRSLPATEAVSCLVVGKGSIQQEGRVAVEEEEEEEVENQQGLDFCLGAAAAATTTVTTEEEKDNATVTSTAQSLLSQTEATDEEAVAVPSSSTVMEYDDSGREVLEIVAASQNKRFSLQQERMFRSFSDRDLAGTLEDDEVIDGEETETEKEEEEEEEESKTKEVEMREEGPKGTKEEDAAAGFDEETGLTKTQREAKVMANSKAVAFAFDKSESLASRETVERTTAEGGEGEEGEEEGLSNAVAVAIPLETPGAYSVIPTSVDSIVDADNESLSTQSRQDFLDQNEPAAAATVDEELHMVEAQLVVEDAQASSRSYHGEDQLVEAQASRRQEDSAAAVEGKLVRRCIMFGWEFSITKAILLAVIFVLVIALVVSTTAFLLADNIDSGESPPPSSASTSTTSAPTINVPTSTTTNIPPTPTTTNDNQTRLEDLRALFTSSEATQDDTLRYGSESMLLSSRRWWWWWYR